MLIIRKEQMAALEAASMRAFEVRTYRHLEQYFPRHCLLLGKEGMLSVIRLGCRKAEIYGFTAECCVRSYIEFMCLLGSHFDNDPLLPWAGAVLREETGRYQIARGDRLYDMIWDYVDHIAQDYREATGEPTTSRFVGELRNLRNLSDFAPMAYRFPVFADSLQLRIAILFPRKAELVGGDSIRNLIDRACKSAEMQGIRGERGIVSFAWLMFVLGSGFADDPLLPWARASLSNAALATETERLNKLYTEGVRFLRGWWDAAPRREARDVRG